MDLAMRGLFDLNLLIEEDQDVFYIYCNKYKTLAGLTNFSYIYNQLKGSLLKESYVDGYMKIGVLLKDKQNPIVLDILQKLENEEILDYDNYLQIIEDGQKIIKGEFNSLPEELQNLRVLQSCTIEEYNEFLQTREIPASMLEIE